MEVKALCENFDALCKQISQLELAKSKLADAIISGIGHDHIGQNTYSLDGLKATITTKVNYTLDKARLNVEWSDEMPINRSFSYTLRERDFVAVMGHGAADAKMALAEIVTSKPAKPVIKLEFK